jgi:hypothetical protein
MVTAPSDVASTGQDAVPVPVPVPQHLAAREQRLSMSVGVLLSLAVHVVLLLIVLNNNTGLGDLERLPIFLVEWIDAPENTRDIRDAETENPAEETSIRERVQPPGASAAPKPADDAIALAAAPRRFDPASIDPPKLLVDDEPVATIRPLEDAELPTPPVERVRPEPRRVELAPLQQLALQQRMLEAVESLRDGTSSEVSWVDEGREYQAKLTRDPSIGSMELEHVQVDVSTSTASGARMRTQLTLKRLAFSQFSQIVDRWDPQVQLHDDVVVGRFHSNTPFYIGLDSSATPTFSGKVTTAARGFRIGLNEKRRKREDMFQGGLQTFTGRIELPKEARPFFGQPTDSDAHVHTFAEDAYIVFQPEGRYSWRSRSSDVDQVASYPPDEPAYFVGAKGVTLNVKGTIDGKVLVYSPERIVIEGSLLYAADPRADSDSDDFLGLVSDKYVEIARPYVTGRGDLNINGAIFARRRFSVRDIDFGRRALLSIYGSLTAGTISATEPRYATKIEFDPRFDRLRPPGFPATNRFEVARAPEAWTESEEHASL